MLNICQICLSTDRKLQTIEETLNNWHDELCDFGIENHALYCTECAYLLKKFHSFKEKCLQANKILKKWKKTQKGKIQLNQLKNELPPSSLGFCNEKNHKVYCSQEKKSKHNDSRFETIDTHLKCFVNPLTNHSGIVLDTHMPGACDTVATTKSATKRTRSSDKKTNQKKSKAVTNTRASKKAAVENNSDEENDSDDNGADLYTETEVKIEDLIPKNDNLESTDIVAEKLQIKSDNDSDNNNFNDSDDEFDIEKLLNDYNSDNSSDDELLIKKRKDPEIKADKAVKKEKKKRPAKKRSLNLSDKEDETDLESKDEKPVKKKRWKDKRGVEQLKRLLMNKFELGEVKDDDGNAIDKDIILENLEKMHIYSFNKIKRLCIGTETFTPEAIQVLATVQKRFGKPYASVFATEHLTSEDEIKKEFIKRQEHHTYTNTEFKCSLCLRGFKHKKLLEYHMSEYHNPDKPFACELCAMRFKTPNGKQKHTAAHRVVYKCKLCPLVTNYTSVMENHFNFHSGVNYSCELCNMKFKTKQGLAVHLNKMHQCHHMCPVCARQFFSPTGLAQHKMRKHSDSKEIEGPLTAKCVPCNVTFISDEIYNLHMERHHAPKEKVMFKTRKKAAFRKQPKFACKECNAIEHSIGRLTYHYKHVHPNVSYESVCMGSQGYKYLCHECGKGYSTITDFNEHKHVHTGAKPYTCPQCPKSFHRRINLRNHMERHLPPTRECPHCGKKFISPSNLHNHIKLHIGLRQYTCDLCSKGFLHRSSLNAHVRGVHLHIRRTRKPAKDQDGLMCGP